MRVARRAALLLLPLVSESVDDSWHWTDRLGLSFSDECNDHEGIGALFTGLSPRIVKVAPSCALMIASYEFGKSFFARRRASES